MSAPPLGSPGIGPDAPSWLFGRFLLAVARAIVMPLFRVRVSGWENLPKEGAYILAGNHVSYLDPVVLAIIMKEAPHFMGHSELFENKLLGWILPRVWAFPVHRGEPDREAIARATKLLQGGEVVGIFPEGTRVAPGTTADEAPLHLGAAFIAMRAGVPVVPVGIAGTDKALPPGSKMVHFSRIRVRFAKPVFAEEFEQGSRKERMAAMTEEIMRRVAEARDEAGSE